MLKPIFEELRRRRVLRVAGFYLAAGWVAFEVAEGTFPRLGLPDWTVTFVLVLLLLAFPLVVGLAWFYDVTPEGVRRTRRDLPVREPDIQPEAEYSRDPSADALASVAQSTGSGAFGKIAVTGAILVLALAGGAFVLLGDRGDTVAVAPDAMVVLPFTVRGGDDVAVLADGMVELLSAKLDGIGDLRSADPHVVLGLAEGGVDPPGARRLARRLGAGHYVLGSVLEFGGGLRLQAEIYETEGAAEPVAAAGVEGDATEFLALVDDLAAELLVAGDLAPPGRMPRIAALTTPDLEALRSFLQGERALRETRYEEAVAHLQRAVEVDSAFALAHYRMAVAASWLERGALKERELQVALRHQDRLGERDRALLAAFTARDVGRHAEADERYRQILASYPDDLEAWYELGEVLVHRGAFLGTSPEEAKRPFERAVDLDPGHGAALFHLSNIAAWQGDLALLDSATEALRSRLGGEGPLSLEAQWAFAMEDSAAMARVLDEIARTAPREDPFAPIFAAWSAQGSDAIRRIMAAAEAMASPSPLDASMAEGLATTLAARGLPDEGVRWLESVETADGSPPIRTATLALVPFLRTPEEEVVRLRDALEAWDPGPVREEPLERADLASLDPVLPQARLYLLGLAETRLGRSGEALQRAQALEELGGAPEVRTLAADLARHVRAQVAMDQGLMAEALRIIESSSFWEATPWDERFSLLMSRGGPIQLRADALQALGRYREAIRWHSVFAFWPAAGYSAYRRAQAWDALGEPDRAAAEYAEMLRIWEDAGPRFYDLVEDARHRLGALTAER
ncbi:MAG: tetratricopeptide repeat protein [Longimicrobiales bacterium]|nr:tetratricopeptide repeat protein [Longimicrobiales bacterium]